MTTSWTILEIVKPDYSIWTAGSQAEYQPSNFIYS